MVPLKYLLRHSINNHIFSNIFRNILGPELNPSTISFIDFKKTIFSLLASLDFSC